MSLAVARRASALGLALTLSVAGTAVADTLTADGDALAAGTQTSVDLGEVVAGSSVTVDVGFVLTCRTSSHLPAGTTIAILPMPGGVSVPDDGQLDVTPGSVTVPGDWPASGSFCSGTEPTVDAAPARLAIVAPTVTGLDRTFDVLFALENDEILSNTPAFTVSMDVVAPQPDPDPDPDPTPDPPATVWTASWDRPLSSSAPALVTKSSRTVPIKVTLLADDQVAGPLEVAPALGLVRRATCESVDILETREAGLLRWDDGRWSHQLDTAPLGAGCWRLDLRIDQDSVAGVDVLIVGGTQDVQSRKR